METSSADAGSSSWSALAADRQLIADPVTGCFRDGDLFGEALLRLCRHSTLQRHRLGDVIGIDVDVARVHAAVGRECRLDVERLDCGIRRLAAIHHGVASGLGSITDGVASISCGL